MDSADAIGCARRRLHESTGIRAPWTGATYAAAAAACIAVGYVGRGMPALVIAAAAGVAGILRVDPLTAGDAVELVPPAIPGEECDAGCIAMASMLPLGAACLAAFGILLRRVRGTGAP